MSWDISRIRALAGVQPLTESYATYRKNGGKLSAADFDTETSKMSTEEKQSFINASKKERGNKDDTSRPGTPWGKDTPVNESYDDDGDDDGMSASERALLKKAEGDLKKKGVKVKDADPDKDLHALAQRRKAKEKAKEEAEDKEEEDEKKSSHPDPRHRDAERIADEQKTRDAERAKKKEEPKKEAPKAEEKKEAAPKKEPEAKKEEPKAEEKKEEPAAEAKRRGKAPNPESFNQHAKANAKNMTRGQFLTWAAEKHGKGKAYASALFAKYNPKSSREVKTNECYMLQHPSVPSFLLAENKMMNQYQWIDGASPMDPLVFETEAEAKKVAQYIYEWKNQTADIVKIDFSDEE